MLKVVAYCCTPHITSQAGRLLLKGLPALDAPGGLTQRWPEDGQSLLPVTGLQQEQILELGSTFNAAGRLHCGVWSYMKR